MNQTAFNVNQNQQHFSGLIIMQKNKMVKKKERPILFSAPMVQAILAGNKTQTRRVVKNAGGDNCIPYRFFCEREKKYINGLNHVLDSKSKALCPYGQVGDRLWVRETWQHANFPYDYYTEGVSVFYRADYKDDPHGYDGEKSPEGKYRHWKPSIFMPRWASRILLEITNVRVERLRDISEQDAIAEGIDCAVIDQAVAYKNYMGGDSFIDWFEEDTAKKSYFSLWESINGRESLESNPWVWCISFRRIDQ